MKKEKNKLQFRFGLFKKTYFFETDVFGLVFEKGPRAVCIYITDRKHSVIFAAIPMGYDKNLRRFFVEFIEKYPCLPQSLDKKPCILISRGEPMWYVFSALFTFVCE